MSKKVLVIASNNQKKIAEIKFLLPDYHIKSLTDIGCHVDIPETADSFEGNALIKAKYVFDHHQLPCFSDDSGLVVKSLSGAPGIYSARYAGEQKNEQENMNKVLDNLKGTKDRSAYFITVICFYDGTPQYFEGRVNGFITDSRRGTNGFGYDPIFELGTSGKTFAELSEQEKSTNSHRALAVKKFSQTLTKGGQ